MANTHRFIARAFDDADRDVRATLGFLVLAGFMTWFAFEGPRHVITFADCIADPRRYDGKELKLSIERVKKVEDGFVVVRAGRMLGRILPPDGVPAGLERGDTISAEGVFRSDGVMEARRLIVHDRRPWKNRASLVGMIGALSLGAALYRWDWPGRGLTERFPDA